MLQRTLCDESVDFEVLKRAHFTFMHTYRGADKSLARPTFRCIFFDASLFVCINSVNILPIMIINRIYETQSLLALELVSFLVALRTYQHS